jgi:hypothetical protein
LVVFPGEVCNVRVSYHISPVNLNHKNGLRNPQSGSDVFFAALLIVRLRLLFVRAGNQSETHTGNLVEKFFQVEAFTGKIVCPDISWITCCDHETGNPLAGLSAA